MEPNYQNQKQRKGVIWIVLLALSLILNLIQWFNHNTSVENYESRVDTLIVERVNVEKELSDTRSELEKYRGISANLDSLLNEAQAKIEEQSKKIKDMSSRERNIVALNKKLKEQLADLQALRDEYLGRIDSLLMANKQLVAEKEELTSRVQTVSKNLENTVATASVLKAEYFKVSTFKRRSSGKYVETALAKRTHKMNVCFDILDNKIAKTGDKAVYLVISEPGGKAIGNRSTGSGMFKTSSGEEIMYTATANMNYTGTKQNICMSYEEQEDKKFPAGQYLIEAYVDGIKVGAANATLR